MEAVERKTMTVNGVSETISRYIDDNRHSRDVNERWLCSMLEPILDLTRQVRSNARLDEETKAKVNAFRASEIEKELQSKRLETEVLERDLAALRRSA